MACLLVPAAEAVITTVATKVVASKEKEEGSCVGKISFSTKLGWLNKLLWGGSALLAFEHVWHGEIVPYAPFLTAASNPIDLAGMLTEMSTVGVTMAVVVTAVWAGMVAVSNVLEKGVSEEEPTLLRRERAR